MVILSSWRICLQHGNLTSQSCFCFRDGVPGALDICLTRRAVARSVSSTPGGRVGICWWTGDVPRLLVTFNRACSMGLATVGVAGRPGGGGGNSFGIETGDATGVASWRRCSMRRDFAQHRGREGFQSCYKLPHVHGRRLLLQQHGLLADSRCHCGPLQEPMLCIYAVGKLYSILVASLPKVVAPALALLAVRGGGHIIMVV